MRGLFAGPRPGVEWLRDPTGPHGGVYPLWKCDGQDTVGDLSLHGLVVEAVAEPQSQTIIALGTFKVEGMPVDPHEMGFFRRDCEVGASGLDVDAGGIHARDEDHQLHLSGLVAEFIIRLAVVRDRRRREAMGRTTGSKGVNDRMHEREQNGSVSSRLGAPGSGGLNAIRLNGGLVLGARAGGFIPMGNNNRTHRDAALMHGLRKRSAGEAALVCEWSGHWNGDETCILQPACQVRSRLACQDGWGASPS